MADVLPFHGLRFHSATVSLDDVLCPPYDVISPAAQEAYHARSPYNAIRLELGAGPTDPAVPGNRYATATHLLQAWQEAGVLVRDPRPAYYLHEHTFLLDGTARTRRGLLAAVRLHDWSSGVVLPHEDTRAGPKQDRLALMRATHASISQLWLLYDDPDGTVKAVLRPLLDGPTIAEATLNDERHVLRAINDPAAVRTIGAAFQGQRLYIADGHHRYETAQQYRDEQRRAHGRPDPDAGYEFALMMLVALDDPGLVVRPTHRLVRATGHSPNGLRAALGRWFAVTPLDVPAGDARAAALQAHLHTAGQTGHVAGLIDADGAWQLRLREDSGWRASLPPGRSTAWYGLDVAILDVLAIRDVCGIHATHEAGTATHGPSGSSGASDRLAYTSDLAEALAAVQTGEAVAAFLLNPTSVTQLCAVAEAGDKMPPKSTYFYPKPPAGLVFHTLDGMRPRP